MKKRSRLRGSTALATAAVLSITGVFWASPTASAGVVLAPTPGHGPSISVVNPDLTPARDSDGSAKTTLQVGTLLLADPGRWNDMSGTKFSYQWAVVDAATGAATDAAASTGKSKNYVPVVSNIGAKIRVTVTATNKTKGDGAGTASVTTATVVVGLNPTLKTAPPAASTKTPYQQVFGKTRPYTTEAFLTMYGYPDNTPPSADIAYPVSGNHDLTFPNHLVGRGIHTEAGGTGTYADPITFATSNTELTAGTEIYIPRFQKYFIGEDSCTECGQDMSGQRPNNPDGTIGPGPDGGPGLIHFDLWVGGGDADWPDVILCEDALTIYDGDNPHMEPIIVNPSPSEPVDQTPIFDPATGKCNTQPDGSSVALDSSLEVGPYENVPGPDGAPGSPNGTHLCMTDPGNSAAVGTKVTMEPCDATRADQNVSFSGAFLIFNNLCLDMGDGMGSPDPEDSGPARAITLQRCNLNANQQWELNTDGSISDIQSSNWALADQGNGVLTATYVADDGNSAYNYFAFPFLREKDATVPVTLDASSVPAGSTVTITGSGLTTPTAEATLIASGDSDGVSLGTVTAAADGTFSQAVTIPAGTAAGAYQVRIVGVADAAPDGTTITDQSQLQFGALANFRPVDRTVPITGVSSDLQVTAAVAPSSAPEPSAAAPAAPATASTGAGNGSWYEWLCAVMAIIGIVAVLIAVRRRLAQQTK